jgi:CheY-like chemotaxis protein
MTASPTLLIIDDEKEIREILEEDAKLLGFETLLAEDGQHGLELARGPRGRVVDAILSDIHMPRMNGLEFLSALRKGGNDIPVVFLTGFNDREKSEAARRLGAFDLLEKPFDHERLGVTLRAAMQLGVSIRDLEAELETLARAYKVPALRLAEFKESQRAILLMKKESIARKLAAS